jgi:hypothetical protein
MADDTVTLAGTAVFISKPSKFKDQRGCCYLVTAAHVVKGIRNCGFNALVLRVNLIGGAFRDFDIDINQWVFHQAEEDTVDVAATLIRRFPMFDHLCYQVDSFVTETVIDQFHIGPGEELVITGLFAYHSGNRRNLPIVRAGNIAAMPEEKVRTEMFDPRCDKKITEIDAYLIEGRSTSGLSGSPVFVYLGNRRRIGNAVVDSEREDGVTFLLGIMQGHWDEKEKPKKEGPENPTKADNINVGIGIVIPAQKIIEVISHPLMLMAEATAEEAYLQRMVRDDG